MMGCIYPFRFKRTQKDDIESSLQSNKKSGLILSSILTPIFYSIVEALNAVLLGAIEPERVYSQLLVFPRLAALWFFISVVLTLQAFWRLG